MKSITIAGNIGRDAVIRHTPTGDAVTGFSVGVSEGRGDAKRTIWFDCSLWGKRGEGLAEYLTKGSKVAVAGELSTRENEGKTYLTVRAHEVTLMGGADRGDSAPAGRGTRQTDPARQAPDTREPADFGDEIPFNLEWR